MHAFIFIVFMNVSNMPPQIYKDGLGILFLKKASVNEYKYLIYINSVGEYTK